MHLRRTLHGQARSPTRIRRRTLHGDAVVAHAPTVAAGICQRHPSQVFCHDKEELGTRKTRMIFI